MKYKIQQIGAAFSNKGILKLEENLNQYSEEGYKFHSVFQVTKPGCLGLGQGEVTNLAIYTKED